jgi:hypothetical protein
MGQHPLSRRPEGFRAPGRHLAFLYMVTRTVLPFILLWAAENCVSDCNEAENALPWQPGARYAGPGNRLAGRAARAAIAFTFAYCGQKPVVCLFLRAAIVRMCCVI